MYLNLNLTREQFEDLRDLIDVGCEAYADKLEIGSTYYTGQDIVDMERQQAFGLMLTHRMPYPSMSAFIDLRPDCEEQAS